MKYIAVMHWFTDEEYEVLSKKYSEPELKWIITKNADKFISSEVEKINNEQASEESA